MIAASKPAPLAARVYATTGWIVSVISAIGAIALRLVDPVPVLPNSFGFGDVALLGFELMSVAFASVGGLLVVRRPRNSVGWIMVLVGVAYSAAGFSAAATYSTAAIGTESARQVASLTGWLTVVLTTFGFLVWVLPAIFPTGRAHTARWRTLVRFAVIPWASALVVLAVQPGPLHIYPTIANPFGVGPDLREWVGVSFSEMVLAVGLVLGPLGPISLVARYRSSSDLERRQLKWFVLSCVGAVVGMCTATGSAALSDQQPGEAGLAVFGFAGTLIPVAIGIAILRHHLYDIDRLISRTIGYGVVTAILAASFAIATLVLQGLLAPLTQGQTIAVAASTLLVLVLFQPLRRRAQVVIDRRFDRERYDAERTLAALAERLRSDMDLQSIRHDIVGVLGGTFHPAAAGVWLRQSATDHSDRSIS